MLQLGWHLLCLVMIYQDVALAEAFCDLLTLFEWGFSRLECCDVDMVLVDDADSDVFVGLLRLLWFFLLLDGLR